MKRPVELVEAVIQESGFPFDDIFLDEIPKEEVDFEEKTQILLSESSNAPEEYGNSEFITMKYGVYIQIFYSNAEDSTIDTVSEELKLMQKLISEGWLIAQSKEQYLDPTSRQMLRNLTVQRTMTLSEIANS